MLVPDTSAAITTVLGGVVLLVEVTTQQCAAAGTDQRTHGTAAERVAHQTAAYAARDQPGVTAGIANITAIAAAASFVFMTYSQTVREG